MKVILAEKPSVARDIAKCLGVTQRKDGYIEGNGYQVTWAFGHLVELKEPDEYFPEWKRWTLDTLPIIPEKFQLRTRGDDSAKKQLNTIKTLFKGADEIICATDAGREGELIFRYILSWSQCLRKPVKRLWINSLTDQAIHLGFENLKDGKRYDNLYRAAQCRSESDWIVGLNATRLYTLSYGQNRRLWSIGRVQTPVLAMIVNRDLAIRDFVPHDFWELATRYRETTFKWAGARFDTRDKAQERLDKTLGQPFRISRVQAKAEKLLPPLYYDLTELQKDMSKRFGFTADQTLSTAQQLYEKKHLTYPRTDSRYLTDDMKAEIKSLLSALGRIKPTEVGKIDLEALTFSKRFFDASKVTDHHAIIPTPVLAGSALSADEAKVYDAVVVRFLASFYPPCLKELTTVVGISAGEEFKTTGTVIKDPGWQTLYAGAPIEEKDEDDNQILPVFIVDESGPHTPFVKAGKTTPPKHFTEGTLLAMMETAGKQCDDDALKEALKNKSLGTPATRAAIIETLITRQYIHRVKKAIVATDSGRHLISLIPDERLKSADLTGEWESKLKRMENGDYDPDLFMQEIADFTRQLKLSAAQPNIDVNQLGLCPRCGQAVIEGKKGYGCSAWKTGCGFTVMKDLYGLSLSKAMLQELLQNRHTALSYPVTVNGEIFDAQLRLEKDGTVTPVKLAASPARSAAVKEALMPCPLCHGQVTEQAKSYSCSEWQNGCPLVIWKTIAGKNITVAMAKKLVKKGETGVLKGFVSKGGKAFEVNLKLVKGKVEMDFEAAPGKKRSE